jgi:hypothetical protein
MGVIRYGAVALAAALLALVASQAVASLNASPPTWPANCVIKKTGVARAACSDNHLNNIDARLRKQGRKIATLESQVTTLQSQMSNAQNQLNCYGGVGIREYGTDGSKGPANQPAFLDITRGVDSNEYKMVTSSC